jgi:hypothetical protein
VKKCLEGYENDDLKTLFLEDLDLIEEYRTEFLAKVLEKKDNTSKSIYYFTYMDVYRNCLSEMSNSYKICHVVKSCFIMPKKTLENIFIIIKNDDNFYILLESSEAYGKNNLPYIFATLTWETKIKRDRNQVYITGLKPVIKKLNGRNDPPEVARGNSTIKLTQYDVGGDKHLSRVGEKAQKNGSFPANYFKIDLYIPDDNDLEIIMAVLNDFKFQKI